jgi:hypothetical protein
MLITEPKRRAGRINLESRLNEQINPNPGEVAEADSSVEGAASGRKEEENRIFIRTF